VGVTTGVGFVGPIGNAARRELAILGDVVNTSARLMAGSAKKGRILCDTCTRDAVLDQRRNSFLSNRQYRHQIAFDKLEPITVKGKVGAISIFRPYFVSDPYDVQLLMTECRPRDVFGFGETMGMLIEDILDFSFTGTTRCTVISGPSGSGKSNLLHNIHPPQTLVRTFRLFGQVRNLTHTIFCCIFWLFF
jgi:hypothetical protein